MKQFTCLLLLVALTTTALGGWYWRSNPQYTSASNLVATSDDLSAAVYYAANSGMSATLYAGGSTSVTGTSGWLTFYRSPNLYDGELEWWEDSQTLDYYSWPSTEESRLRVFGYVSLREPIVDNSFNYDDSTPQDGAFLAVNGIWEEET